MTDDVPSADLLVLTVQIVAAHIGNSATGASALPALIRSVHAALSQAGTGTEEPAKQEPAVSVKRSVFPDYLVCLEDGKKLKTLKRHLASAFGMTPEQYREKWGLPTSYPMVAPSYAKRRSELAKTLGLGRKPLAPAPEPLQVMKVREGVSGRKKAAAAKRA
jgi:predicted transcriptional regulator